MDRKADRKLTHGDYRVLAEFRAQFNRLQNTDAQSASVRQFFAERHDNGKGVAA